MNIKLLFTLFFCLLSSYNSVMSGCVTVYQHCNYEGWSKTYCNHVNWVGNDLNDQISAIKVGPRTAAVLYRDAEFKSAVKYFEVNDSCLVDNQFNDVVSSIRVFSW